ncbi:protein toll-like [Belonocnema kinseyi]|uniref:protein toll-like n=1 Tax=Belonocnema kinseyi TaxID=2817044 RepID=UPI00143DDC6E|nr:protein toll-like [Belonocnema kinseyi]XP_033226700.1 protein toll-like [Belonocnema kinseyi]
MQLPLRIFFAFVFVVDVIGNDCQNSEYNEECRCVSDGPKTKMYCPDFKSVNWNSFQIIYLTGQFVEITCKNNPSWSDFHFEIRRQTKGVKEFALRNCTLDENTNLAEIARLVGAENTKRLQFTNNLKHKSLMLRRNHLQGFSNVEKLEITENQLLGDLTEDLLEPLPKVKTLFLRNNNIKVIPKNFFTYVPELQTLELGNNKIQSLDPELFKSLKNLTFLNLWNNEISELNNITFDGLFLLKSLDLHGNNFKTLPANIFEKLEKLQVVNLSGSQLESLPGTLFQKNQELNKVKLRDERKLTSLPNGLFSNLKNLKIVQFDGSKLENLPEDLFHGSLEVNEISVTGNSLKTLPKKIFEGLEKLQTLFLNYNQIEDLPDNIFNTNKNLLKLSLTSNQIQNISGSLFKGLLSLKKLDLQNNSVSFIDKNAFTLLPNVEVINLSHNNISDILVLDDMYMVLSVFYGCEKLQTLDLSYNKINRIFSDWTTQPPLYFKLLNLSHNDIDIINNIDMDFKQTQDFEIYLSDNKIRRIDMSDRFEEIFLQETRRRIKMHLWNNPLQCDCFLYDFIRYLEGSRAELKRNLQIDIGPMECSSPNELKGTLIADLKSKDYRCIESDSKYYEGTCPEVCSRWIKPSDHKLIFDCAYRNLTEAPKRMCRLANNEYTTEVNLTGNFIRNIPNMNQIGYDKVRHLILSTNNISTIPENGFSSELLSLELDNNTITAISSAALDHLKNTTLQNIKLGGNPWKCDCEARNFQQYLQSDEAKDKFQVLDAGKITCQDSKKALKTMTVNELCPSETEMIIGISLTTAILGLAIGTLVALYYRYQREIKVWLYAHRICLWFVTEEELDKDKPYDAFISYSHKDEHFIVNELIPKLEEGPRPFKLCVHFRDWLAGEWIPNQIAKSVRDSKRTIVVVSPNFVQSEWGRLEFRTAHSQALNEGRGRVVVILYGDIGPTDKLEPELQAYLSMNTYAKWGDPWFWEKLCYFLPHKPNLPDVTPESRIFAKQDLSAQLNFNKSELKECPLNDMSLLTENPRPIDAEKQILQNGNIFIDMSDDETKILNSAC